MLSHGTCRVVASSLTQPLSQLQLEAVQGASELREVPSAAGGPAAFPGARVGRDLHALARDGAVPT